jgi:hypothetical protein
MRLAPALLFCAACSAATSDGAPDATPFSVTQPTQLAPTPLPPRDMVADADAVYWIGGTTQPATYELHRIDLRTREDSLLASGHGLFASQVAMDDTSLYWTESDTLATTIKAVAKTDGAPRPLESSLPYDVSVAVDAGRIYWIDPNGGARSARASDGGDVQHLDDVAGQAAEIDADPARHRLVFMPSDGVYAIPEAGPARTRIGDAAGGDLAVGDTRLAYTAWLSGGLVVADLQGGNPQRYLDGSHEGRVAMLGDTVYWNDISAGVGQTPAIHRLASGDTAPTTVAMAPGGSTAIAVTAAAVFYGDGNAVWAAPR